MRVEYLTPGKNGWRENLPTQITLERLIVISRG
jgi:hypothetical protein